MHLSQVLYIQGCGLLSSIGHCLLEKSFGVFEWLYYCFIKFNQNFLLAIHALLLEVLKSAPKTDRLVLLRISDNQLTRRNKRLFILTSYLLWSQSTFAMSVWGDQNGKFGDQAQCGPLTNFYPIRNCISGVLHRSSDLTAVKSRSLSAKSLVQNAGCSGHLKGTKDSRLGPEWLAAPRKIYSTMAWSITNDMQAWKVDQVNLQVPVPVPMYLTIGVSANFSHLPKMLWLGLAMVRQRGAHPITSPNDLRISSLYPSFFAIKTRSAAI